jgi:hypothetical protein
VHGEELVEPGDLQRPPGLEAGRREHETVFVVQLRARLDQDAERGGVDELDLAEVDDDPLRSLGPRVGKSRTNLTGVVEIELATQVNDLGGTHFLHAKHRVLVQAVSGDIPPVVCQPPSWLA